MVNFSTTEKPSGSPLADRLPFWSHVFGLILYILLFLAAVLGNSIALLILRTKQELRTLTHAFLTNLVVADLLLSLLTPFEAMSIFLRSYAFGDAGCKLQRTFLYFFYAASILTLSAISLERFIAICYPLLYDAFKEHKTKIIALIWLVSVVIVCPHVYLSEARTIYGDTACFQFHTTQGSKAAFFWGYAVPCFLLLYLIPLIIMSVTHWKATQKLREMERRMEVTSQFDLSATVRVRKEVLRMLLVVVLLFVVQWTPFEIVELLAAAPDVMQVNPISSLRVAVNIVAFSNAVFNPVVYGFMSKPFREGFKEAGLYLIKFKCCSRQSCLNNLTLPLQRIGFMSQRKNKSPPGSTTDLTEFSRTTQCEVDWDSSFGRLSKPVSIVEKELACANSMDNPDCAIDHKL